MALRWPLGKAAEETKTNVIDKWLTVGMSAYDTPGFQDTSRLMTAAFPGVTGYIEPPKPIRNWRRLDGTILRWQVRQSDGLTVYEPPLPIPHRCDPFGAGLGLQTRDLLRELTNRFGDNWRETTVVYFTNWSAEQQPLVAKLMPKHLIFDLVDDVLSFPYTFDRARVLKRWRWLAQHASVVLAVSPVLQRHAANHLGVDAEYLPNGVDVERFYKEAPTRPEDVRSSSDTVKVGFAGTLNHWIDFAAIEKLASEFPDIEFHLFGRTGHFGSDEAQAAFVRLEQVPNVQLRGPIPYELLPAHLFQMDILMLPRLRIPSSESSSPLKLYEYMAVGKPVVSSGVVILDDMQPLVYAADDGSGIPLELRKALDEVHGRSLSLTAERQAYALTHTWKQRVQQVLALLQQRGNSSPLTAERGANGVRTQQSAPAGRRPDAVPYVRW